MHRIQTSTNVVIHSFTFRRGIDSSQLPPWHDTLYQHVLRSKFQAGIWKCCLDANMQISRLNCYGWSVDTAASFITTTRLTGLPTLQRVMDLLRCECYLACVALNCACITNRMKYRLGQIWGNCKIVTVRSK